MTIAMIDSIVSPQTTGQPIPQAVMTAPAVAGYIAGNSWPTYGPYAAARPDLVKSGRLVSVTLTAGARARCLDIESGGATAGQAPGWFKYRADRTNGLPILYTFASNVRTVTSVMTSAGVARNQYLVWAAHFNFTPHICAPSVCGYPQADGTQWTDRWPGGCDASVMGDQCFQPQPSPTPTPPEGTVAIAMGSNQDGRLAIAVELSTGEVKHLEQQAPNGDWWKNQDGTFNWLSLGNPGK